MTSSCIGFVKNTLKELKSCWRKTLFICHTTLYENLQKLLRLLQKKKNKVVLLVDFLSGDCRSRELEDDWSNNGSKCQYISLFMKNMCLEIEEISKELVIRRDFNKLSVIGDYLFEYYMTASTITFWTTLTNVPRFMTS